MPPMPYIVTAQNPKIKLLVYGKVGAGKTTLACTAMEHPDLAPILVLNFEGGLLSVAGKSRIPAIDVHTIDELTVVLHALYSNDPIYAEYKTIVIDSGSELLAKAQQEVVDRNVARGRGGDGRTIDEYQIDDYGVSGNMMKRLFRGFRDLPRNVIITALPRDNYQRIGKQTTSILESVTPAFTGQLCESVMGFMDFVWYMYKLDPVVDEDPAKCQPEKRFVLTSDYAQFRAKTRGEYFSHFLGQTVENPYLPDIYELLRRAENPESRMSLTGMPTVADMNGVTPGVSAGTVEEVTDVAAVV